MLYDPAQQFAGRQLQHLLHAIAPAIYGQELVKARLSSPCVPWLSMHAVRIRAIERCMFSPITAAARCDALCTSACAVRGDLSLSVAC